MAPRDGPGPFANAIGIAAGITLGGVIVKVRVRPRCARPPCLVACLHPGRARFPARSL